MYHFRFAPLPDPRIDRTKRHLLVDILFLTLVALLAGAEDCVSIADSAHTKQRFFAQWLELPNGIPSHDTFNRVLARLDPDALNRCFLEWVTPIRHRLSAQKAPTADPEIVEVDGKQLRGSKDSADGQKAVTLVSAWATSLCLALGQVAQNVAVIRHIALNLLRQDKVTKMGVKNRRLKAGWDEDYP